MSSHTRRHAGSAAALVLVAASVEAHVTKQLNSLESYWFLVHHVPDLDQVRTVLPGHGDQFCVPTTAINWMGYFANHGGAVWAPQPHNWSAQGNYDLASFLIASMSDCSYMCTDPDEGTDFYPSVNGLKTWLGPQWVVSTWMRDEDWSPSFDLLATQGLNGGYLIPGIGWYVPDGPICLERDGGHAFAVTGMVRGGSLRTMRVSDPATDDDEADEDAFQQSSFTSETYECVPELRNPKCGTEWYARAMYRFVGLSRDGGQKLGYLDSIRAIFPQFVVGDTGPGELTYTAIGLQGGLAPVRSFMTMSGEPIVDAVLGADLGHSIVVTGAHNGSLGGVWVHTPGFDHWEEVELDVSAPSDAVAGRHREVYVVDGLRLVCFDIDTREIEEEVELPATAQALVYDDAADEVIAVSVTEHLLIRYPHGLVGEPTYQDAGDLPSGEDVSAAWDPTDGAVWCIVTGDAWVHRVNPGPEPPIVQVIELPEVEAPQAIAVGDDGRVYVSDQGVIKEYSSNGEIYEPAFPPFFEGRAAGGVLSIARSRTNLEPHLIDETFHHAVPTEFGESIPYCHADIDGDGFVGVDDLVAVIVAWGSDDPYADIAPDGGDLQVDVDDLLEILLAWGPCPGQP